MTSSQLLSTLSLVLIFTWFIPIAAYAQKTQLSLKQLLLMPDKLTNAHAEIESQCNKCHLHFDKSNQSPLCLDCHEEIQDDLTKKQNFHSTINQEKIERCSSCHSDHKGRSFDITSFDIDHFNHDKTDFKLENRHLNLPCDQCHLAKFENFRINLNKETCTSCHEDVHQEKFNDSCQSCHDSKSWQVNDFDHKKTEFPLKAAHQQLACTSCHVTGIIPAVDNKDDRSNLGGQCINCHLGNDKHLGIFKDQCQDCHNENDWQETDYNHYLQTDYPLLGKHQKLTCNACHAEELSPKKQCIDCHKGDDVHLTNNGVKCGTCHNNESWTEISFNHQKETNIELQGAHKELACSACHTATVHKEKKDQVRTCIDCHKVADVHQNNLGENCQKCHRQQHWDQAVSFNHDFTLFPLTGSHQLTTCRSCHANQTYALDSFTCNDCHSEYEPHQATLGSKCESCHNTASWSTWQFDHQKQSDFLLEGAHSKLACSLCHTPQLPKPLSPGTSCIACHQSDDVHQGAFGKDCQQCHTTGDFYDFKQ